MCDYLLTAHGENAATVIKKLKIKNPGAGLCNNLVGGERVGGGGRFQREGTHIHWWLIHVEVKPIL